MYRILVADDEPTQRMVLSEKINMYYGEQAEVVTAQNGIEAVDKFAKKEFDVVILDISMPRMSGLEVASIIRENDSKCSIIFMSSFGEFSYAKRAMELKALNYILKPGNDDELLMTLDEAFDIADGFSKQNDDSLINTLDNASVKTSAVANKVSDYIEEHYTENISLREVADAMGYSDAYFCKIFKQCFEMSFISYLNSYRTKKAIDLLGDVTVSIKDISAMSGYRDANYFTRIFKKTTGVTPSEYRERVIKGDINYVI